MYMLYMYIILRPYTSTGLLTYISDSTSRTRRRCCHTVYTVRSIAQVPRLLMAMIQDVKHCLPISLKEIQ